jgi:undecaprenyl-diphosphatase
MVNLNKLLNFASPKYNKILLWISASFLFFALFLKLTFEVLKHKGLTEIDAPILLFISTNIRTPHLTETAIDITALGSPPLISLFTIIGLIILFVKKDRFAALFLAINVIGATAWMAFLKNLIARERPQIIPRLIEISGLSYPSGHSLVSSATSLTFAFLIGREIKSKKLLVTIFSFAFLIIFTIGFSRLYLGVHYPSDVLSGICFGLSWVLFITAIFKIFSKNHH